MDMNGQELTVYIDGACQRNGKVGSIASYGIYWIHDGTKIKARVGENEKQTNNTGELYAAVEALRYAIAKGFTNIQVKSDSEYLIRGITKDVKYWRENGWKLKSTHALVKNREIWEKLYELNKQISVKWTHVKRDSDEGQRIADELAKEAINVKVYKVTTGEDERPVDDGADGDDDDDRREDAEDDGNATGKDDAGDNHEDTFLFHETFVKHVAENPVVFHETSPKHVNETDFGSCLMCENIGDDKMIACDICHGNVHYVCTLLPGYFLSMILHGCIKYRCYNCSGDNGSFRDKNFIDKVCTENGKMKQELREINGQVSKFKLENDRLVQRMQSVEDSCQRRINEMKTNVEKHENDISVRYKEEIGFLKSKLEEMAEETKKKDKMIKDISKDVKNKESKNKDLTEQCKLKKVKNQQDEKH